MREYFESEMRLLHEAAVDFARAHPEQARMLNLSEVQDRDPYVERLLEGMAFIAAQIRSRIDDSESRISEQLLEQLAPGQLRGYPSRAVMLCEFAGGAHSSKVLDAGSQIRSAPMGDDNTECVFTTLSPVTVAPLCVDAIQCEESGSGDTRMTLTLKPSGPGSLTDLALSELNFFLHCDPALAMSLVHGLTAQQQTITIQADGQPCGSLPASNLTLPYLQPQASDSRHRANPAFALLQDYFAWRERFHFLRLDGLDSLALPDKARSLQISFTLPVQLPAEYPLRPEHIQLNAVPAINLYEQDAEPLDVDQKRAAYRFLPDQRRPDSVVLHELLSLQGRDRKGAAITDYRPFYQARDLSGGQATYRISRQDMGLETPQAFISLSGSGLIHAQTLSARVSVSNGFLPRRYLSEKQISKPVSGIPSSLRLSNLQRPSAWLPCPDSNSYRWQLQSLLQMPVSGIANQENLQALMGLLDWTGRKENQRRREALQSVSVQPVTRMKKGMLYRGIAVELDVNEGDFLSLHDIYLFGSVLHAVLASMAAINESVELKIIAQPAQKELLWEPQTGCLTPL